MHKGCMTCQHHHHDRCIQDALAQAEQHCAQKSLRFTDLRRKVFTLLWSSHKAMTASDVMDVLGRNQPPLTYRALDFLKEQKLVHYVASLNAYVGCIHPEKNHIGQLFICSSCRDVLEIDCATSLQNDMKDHARKNGFTVQHTLIEVLGLCASCSVSPMANAS
jgi:Fur family zinc uptake transcriptional regulator